MLIARFVCLLAFLSLAGETDRSARAQAAGEVPFVFRKARRQHARVPIEVQRNLLVVKARLNGFGPFNFLLDTGVGTSILTSAALADSLGLRRGQLFRVVGAGGVDSGLKAFQSDSVRVELPGVVAPAMSWLVLADDVLNLSGYVGVPVAGILGSELFRSFVVTLRPEEKYLLLDAPAAFRPPRGRRWSTVPLVLENNKAYFTAEVQLAAAPALPLKLVLDTGASHALSIELDSDPRLVGPAPRLTADLGRGLSGTVKGYLARVATLRLGRYALRSVLTSFPNAGDVHDRLDVPRNGNVGYELLKRFALVVDYPHRRLLLRPNALLHDPFEFDMCGVELLATGPDYRRFVVLHVMPDSPAAVAGLAVDDELLSVNFMPASTFTLTQLDRLLHSEDGRSLLLVLRRPDGQLFTTTVRLRRQI